MNIVRSYISATCYVCYGQSACLRVYDSLKKTSHLGGSTGRNGLLTSCERAPGDAGQYRFAGAGGRIETIVLPWKSQNDGSLSRGEGEGSPAGDRTPGGPGSPRRVRHPLGRSGALDHQLRAGRNNDRRPHEHAFQDARRPDAQGGLGGADPASLPDLGGQRGRQRRRRRPTTASRSVSPARPSTTRGSATSGSALS